MTIHELRADAPECPGPTCPTINQTIDRLNEVRTALLQASESLDEHGLDNPVWGLDVELDAAVEELESLRDDNAALRDTANWWEEQAEELCGEIATLVD